MVICFCDIQCRNNFFTICISEFFHSTFCAYFKWLHTASVVLNRIGKQWLVNVKLINLIIFHLVFASCFLIFVYVDSNIKHTFVWVFSPWVLNMFVIIWNKIWELYFRLIICGDNLLKVGVHFSRLFVVFAYSNIKIYFI